MKADLEKLNIDSDDVLCKLAKIGDASLFVLLDNPRFLNNKSVMKELLKKKSPSYDFRDLLKHYNYKIKDEDLAHDLIKQMVGIFLQDTSKHCIKYKFPEYDDQHYEFCMDPDCKGYHCKCSSERDHDIDFCCCSCHKLGLDYIDDSIIDKVKVNMFTIKGVPMYAVSKELYESVGVKNAISTVEVKKTQEKK